MALDFILVLIIDFLSTIVLPVRLLRHPREPTFQTPRSPPTVQGTALAWARTTLSLPSKKVMFSLSVDLLVRLGPAHFNYTRPCSPFDTPLAGKVVDDKKVFRKFVNVQEENNNPQK